MRTKIVLEKVYTRDNSVIIQQAWYSGITKVAENLGRKSLFKKRMIYYLNNGVIEIWENHKATNWLINRICKENLKGDSFYKSTVKEYHSILKKLKYYWDKKTLDNKVDLEKFVDLIFKGMRNFAIVYYSALNDNTPKQIKLDARRMRDEDIYFDQNDKTIRKSLKKIYPELKGLECGVLRSEISNLPSIKILKERNNNFIFDGEEYYKIITMLEYRNENKNKLKFLIEEIEDDKRTFSGLSAYPGLITGKIKVVKRKDQITQVIKNEIIVSAMTTPDFVPAMKKASAFITDEGGITCHAAIIARELKKPCIIGTKIATKVLKDGDLVEVDANKGIVKILKRA